MKTRIIHTKIWTDSYFLELSSEERYLFVYYLTNPHVNIIHLYECPNRIASFETGLTIKLIQATKQKFEKDKKILFFKDYVYLKNAGKYESFKGSTNEIAIGKLLNELSKDVLGWYSNISDTPIHTLLTPSITHMLEHGSNKIKRINDPMNEDIDPDSVPL